MNYMMVRIGKFERKLLRHLKKAEQVTTQQLRRVGTTLFPERGLQERMGNGMSYLSRYGMDLMDELLQAVPASYGQHYMVELS
jgi:uncharacterized protein YllA (UPF0747 family)